MGPSTRDDDSGANQHDSGIIEHNVGFGDHDITRGDHDTNFDDDARAQHYHDCCAACAPF